MKLKSKISVLVLMLMLMSNISMAQGGYDIYVKNATYSPSHVYEGDQVIVNFTVGNYGDGTATINVGLFVDNRSKVVDTLTVTLNGRESKEESLYWFAKEGHHVIYIFADYDNQINEVDEDNNLISIDINVEKPNYPVFPPENENATWWNEKWHYRVPVTASMFGERAGYEYRNKMVFCNINFTDLMNKIYYMQAGSFSKRTFLPSSVRVVEYELNNKTWVPYRNVGCNVILADDYDAVENANVTVMWVMQGDLSPHERRYYYIYWDTKENGEKPANIDIYSGIKNGEFEDTSSTAWKNYTTGTSKWEMGYEKDPLQGDECYGMHISGLYGNGLIWMKDAEAKISQQFNIPDEGQGNYILHASVYVYSDINIFEWDLAIGGKTIASGDVTSGWMEITKNITSYLSGRGTSSISFSVKITQSNVYTAPHSIDAYIDSVWLETENADVILYKNSTHGWWGDLMVKRDYTAGVEGENTLTNISVLSSASPKEIVAELYSPKGKLVAASMPLPDPCFEEGLSSFFVSDEKTAIAKTSEISHTGDKSVMLKLTNYIGNFRFEDESVKAGDTAGFRQNITHGIPMASIPSLYFWYKVEKASANANLNYTLLTTGSKPKFYTIPLSSLSQDGQWHKYEIPQSTLTRWRSLGGMASAVEIRLIATADDAECSVYIDDLGYSFMPANATDRTNWILNDLYTFTKGSDAGKWRLDITMTDGSDYRIEKSVILNVDAAANINVFDIKLPDELKEGEQGKFVVYLKNDGPKGIDENTPINVSLTIFQGTSNSIKMSKSIAGLAVNEIKTVEFEWTASYGEPSYNGTWQVMAKANENGRIPEWNKMDNWQIKTLNVIPRPDMEISMGDISFEPSHPSNGSTVNISVIVHNVGYKDGFCRIKIYEKKAGERRYTIIPNGSIEKTIAKGGDEKATVQWKGTNGTYHIKVMVECDDEINNGNNVAIKDIKVGGGMDITPPIIENVRASPDEQGIGEAVNISATIYDENTTIDRAIVYIMNDTDSTSYQMERVGESNVYYANVEINKIGKYEYYIEAWDSSLYGNKNDSSKYSFRIIYSGIETQPPEIKGVSATPERQVIGKAVNITAYVNDDTGIASVSICIERNGSTHTYEMKNKNGTKVYYYTSTYDTPGEYIYYITAIDSSANKNVNTSSNYTFEIPADYDGDGIPDEEEINIGANPENASDAINVGVDGYNGYLIWIEKGKKYVYWDANDNSIRDTELKDVDGDGVLDVLFDASGNGIFDHYYNPQTKNIGLYSIEEKQPNELVWIIPPVILFIIVAIAFVMTRKR